MQVMPATTTIGRRCPRCGHAGLRPVDDTPQANLLCLECRCCWQPEDRHLVQVNPHACAGCPDRPFCMFRVDEAVSLAVVRPA